MSASTLRVDPHVHSAASYDGHDPPWLLLEQAADIGLDAIVVTDHDSIDASLVAADMASEYGLLGIPGVEVSTAHGHLLAVGVETRPEPGHPLPETAERVREQGGAAIVPHPFQRTRHGARSRHVRRAAPDAIETYNAWLFTGYRNRRARSFARRHGYVGVAGSDAHSVATVGRAFTEITIDRPPEQVDPEHVVGAIRRGATDVEGSRAPMHRCAAHYAKGAGRKTAWAARGVARGVAATLY
jgi:predicted metal-dependent phosphoesterase TrpH